MKKRKIGMKLFIKKKSAKSENNTAMKSDLRYEECIVCGKMTQVLKEQPIECRSFYIYGCGQLCYECYHEIYPEIRIWDKTLTE